MIKYISKIFNYEDYIDLQISSSGNDLIKDIRKKLDQLKKDRLFDDNKKLYTINKVNDIVKECDELISKVPEAKKYWTDQLRNELYNFLKILPLNAYKSPEELYREGKRRDYRLHIEYLANIIPENDSKILDLAGRTGWASTILKYLGYKNSYTLELNPINVIGGRYVWGHTSIFQGDVLNMREGFINRLNFKIGSEIDFLFLRYSLEHIINLKNLFSEFNHILKPKGKALIIVGQSFKRSLKTGDIHPFPTLRSITRHIKYLKIKNVDYIRNTETNQLQYFILLEK